MCQGGCALPSLKSLAAYLVLVTENDAAPVSMLNKFSNSLVGGASRTLKTSVGLQVEVKGVRVRDTAVDDETRLEVSSAVGVFLALGEETHVVLKRQQLYRGIQIRNRDQYSRAWHR